MREVGARRRDARRFAGVSATWIRAWPSLLTAAGMLAAILAGISVAFGYIVVPLGLMMAGSLTWLGLRHPLASSKLLLLLSALYFPIKLALPSPLDSVWLDIVLVTILAGWLFSVVMGSSIGSVKSRTVVALLSMLLAWGAIEVLRAPSMLYGLFGFRTVLASFLAFGVFAAASATSSGRTAVLNTMLGIGCAIAVYCVAEFVAINAHLLAPGSWIDVGRAIYMGANEGYPPSPRFGFTRSLGPWPDPSQAALYMTGALGLGLRGLWNGTRARLRKLSILLLSLGVASTLSTWPMVVVVLLLAGAIVLQRPSGVPERIVWVAVGGITAFGLVFIAFRLPAPLSSEIPKTQVPGYSATTLYASTSNLREALRDLDLLGDGLYDRPSTISQPVGGTELENLGSRYLFLDDLVSQLGLIGVLLLLALWTAGIVKAYSIATRRRGSIDIDQLATALALTGLLLASQHYGAPLIYGVNYMLVALLATVGIRKGPPQDLAAAERALEGVRITNTRSS